MKGNGFICLMLFIISFCIFIGPHITKIHKGPIQTQINTECISGQRHYQGIPLYKFDKNAKDQTSPIYCPQTR